MITQTSEGGMLSDGAKSEESRASTEYDMTEQSSTMEEVTFAEPNKKIVPVKESPSKKFEGRKYLMKMVSSLREKEGGKLSLADTCSWEQKVDEAYTELVLSLQEAWETHVLKIRSQLRKMMAKPSSKRTQVYDQKKSLFNFELARGSIKEEQNKRLHLVVLIIVSIALLGICVVNSVRIQGLRQDLTDINKEYELLQKTLGSMMEKMDRLPETIRKQSLPLIDEMRREIRFCKYYFLKLE
ncbi:uncharacterized protein [Halyomorpha halys]|uniref:uncharacterized protein isoform X2 n=1 Tax=Halyomorpha halys TaxID=286706 RepID=UPI0006D5094C|nr:uncharacterized protein LOC106682522 isoform X2 [Halyomorpha halys]